MYGMRKLESSISQTAILGSFLLRRAAPRQGRGRALLRNAPGSLPAEQSQRAAGGLPKLVFLPPFSQFLGEGNEIPVCFYVMGMKRTSANRTSPWTLFCWGIFFFKSPANCWQVFLMENTNRLRSIPSLLPIMRKLHLLSPAILRKSFAVIPTNPITDC